MSGTDDHLIQQALAGLITLVVVCCALWGVLRLLRRSRPGLAIGIPVAVALVLRITAAIAISLIGVGELRGPDEGNFVLGAEQIAATPFLTQPWVDALTRDLHQFVLALQIFTLDSPELALRLTHIGIAVAGIALLAAAVHELAGARASLIAAWLLALEPTGVFYSEVLHKEANMILGAGLVSLGAATLWQREDWHAVIPMVLGCVIAGATRYYAGLFLALASAALIVHLWIRSRWPGRPREVAVAATALLVVAVGLPLFWQLTTPTSLARLQERQVFQTTGERANLALEPVDFSSRQGVILALPRRVRDVLLRPYPWQLANTKQRIGLFGTVVVLVTLIWLAAELIRNRGRIMDRAAPLVYVAFFLLVAYSLSAANSGTAFRYRAQLEALAVCLILVLAQDRFWQPRPQAARRSKPHAEPALVGASPSA